MTTPPVRRLRRLVMIILLVGVAPLIMIPFGIGFIGVSALVRPPCGEWRTPALYDLPFEDVRIPTRGGGEYRAFFIPGNPSQRDSGRNKTTIVIPPPFAAGRDGMLAEAQLLVRAGYTVLLYESRACAGKPLILGYRDGEDIGDAIAYLKGRGMDTTRLALHGFSSAGAASTMAMVHYPEVRGAVAEGGYHNLDEIMGFDGQPANPLEALMEAGMAFAYRFHTGDDSSVLNPIGALDKIPPRGLFLVYGEREVTLVGARRQLARLQAANPSNAAAIALWVVPGADHGGYVGAVGEAVFSREMIAFYDCVLLERCEAWKARWETP